MGRLKAKVFPNQDEQIPLYRYFNRTDRYFADHKHIKEIFNIDFPNITTPVANSTDKSFENIFGNRQLYDVLRTNIKSVVPISITTLSQYFDITYNKLNSSKKSNTSFFVVIKGTALMNRINNLTHKSRMDGYLQKLFINNYKGYSNIE